MLQLNWFKSFTRNTASLTALVAGALLLPAVGQAQISTSDAATVAKILKGFQIAPVPLNMGGLDPSLVGYGSYLVNAVGGCNDCHTLSSQAEYLPGNTPYLGQKPTKMNPALYLGGGNDFGAFPDPAGPFPHIISRNLTPDASGLPVGGATLKQFMDIIRNGTDIDHVHPTCTGAPNGKCLPAPFDGDLLQIMPWPIYQNMTDDDLTAIYTYLTTVPCLEGGPNEPAKRCGTAPTAATTAIAGPKNITVDTRQAQLDGSKSTSFDGKPLQYAWTIPQGSNQAGISGAFTATPTVQFGTGRGAYMFQLTVTDSAGKTSSDFVTVNFAGN